MSSDYNFCDIVYDPPKWIKRFYREGMKPPDETKVTPHERIGDGWFHVVATYKDIDPKEKKSIEAAFREYTPVTSL